MLEMNTSRMWKPLLKGNLRFLLGGPFPCLWAHWVRMRSDSSGPEGIRRHDLYR